MGVLCSLARLAGQVRGVHLLTLADVPTARLCRYNNVSFPNGSNYAPSVIGNVTTQASHARASFWPVPSFAPSPRMVVLALCLHRPACLSLPRPLHNNEHARACRLNDGTCVRVACVVLARRPRQPGSQAVLCLRRAAFAALTSHTRTLVGGIATVPHPADPMRPLWQSCRAPPHRPHAATLVVVPRPHGRPSRAHTHACTQLDHPPPHASVFSGTLDPPSVCALDLALWSSLELSQVLSLCLASASLPLCLSVSTSASTPVSLSVCDCLPLTLCLLRLSASDSLSLAPVCLSVRARACQRDVQGTPPRSKAPGHHGQSRACHATRALHPATRARAS